MTDESIDERLAEFEAQSEESSDRAPSLEDSASPADSSDGSTSISLWTRFWTVFVLAGQVRIVLELATGLGGPFVGKSLVLGSLVGGIVVAEVLLRQFGPAIAPALWDGCVAAVLAGFGAFLLWTVTTGSSPPDGLFGIGVLVLSAAITVRRFDPAEAE